MIQQFCLPSDKLVLPLYNYAAHPVISEILVLYNNAAHPVISEVWYFSTMLHTQLYARVGT